MDILIWKASQESDTSNYESILQQCQFLKKLRALDKKDTHNHMHLSIISIIMYVISGWIRPTHNSVFKYLKSINISLYS